MSNPACLTGPPFSLSGNPIPTGQQVSFQLLFDSSADQATVLAYEWYLNNLLIVGQNNPTLSASLDCGTYTIGSRILTAQGWSGVQNLTFQTCAAPVSVVINGPGSIGEGATADFRVIGTYLNGTSIDVTDQYVLSATEGVFTGHTFTAATNNTSNDTRQITITASKDGVAAVTKQVTVTDTTVAAEPYPIGILVLDIYNDPALNVLAYIENTEVSPNSALAYTGNNIIPSGTPAQALILTSDLINQPVLNWRFEFNIAKLVASFPATPEFVFHLKGRSDAVKTVSGVFALKSGDAVVTLSGSPGSYIPSVSGGTTVGNIIGFTGNVLSGADGTYNPDSMITLIRLVYNVAGQSITFTT